MANSKRLGMDMTSGNIAKQMLTYALPIMLASALQQVYSMVDMIIVGQFVGKTGLSAISLGSQACTLAHVLAMGFIMGTQVILAQYAGAKKFDDMGKVIGTSFSINGIIGLLITVILLCIVNPCLKIVNCPPEAYAGARSYMLIYAAGSIFVVGYHVVSAVLRGMGDSKRPLIFIAISSVINIILDLLFVGAFKWDAAGAALATIIAQAIAFIFALVFLYRRKESFHFDFKLKSLKIDGDIFKKLLILGLPQALQSGAIHFSMLYITSQVNTFGVAASAAFGVGQKIEHIPMIATQGFSQGVSAMVGQNFAAGKFDRVKKSTRCALLFVTVINLLVGVIYFFFPEGAFSLFTKDSDVLALAKMILWIMLLAYPANILMNTYRGVINGVGFATLGMAIGLFDGVILRIGLAILVGNVMSLGLKGYIMGYSLAAYGTAIPALIYYLSGAWKRRKSLVAGKSGAPEEVEE